MKKTIAAVATFATLFTGMPAFAQGMGGGEQRHRPLTPAATCEERDARLEERISRKQAAHKQLETRYDRFVERMDQLLEDAEEADVDTSDLSDALESFDELHDAVVEDYEALMEAMTDLSGTACDMTQEEWLTEMQGLKTYGAELDADGKAIRAFVKDTLRPAVKAVADEVHPRE